MAIEHPKRQAGKPVFTKISFAEEMFLKISETGSHLT